MNSSKKTKPDATEMAAKVLLEHLDCRNIDFEPNGETTPPDFRIYGNIGIEVTRLNRYFQTPEGPKSIESIELPVEKLPNQWLKTLPVHNLPCTVWVQLLFEREGGIDLKPYKTLLLKSIEGATMAGNFMRRIQISDKLEFQLIRSTRIGDQPYKAHPSSGGSGYMIDSHRMNALRKAIAHKSYKANSIKNHYSALWLILEDRVAICVEDSGLAEIDLYGFEHPFSRIILFSWQNPEEWIELVK